MMAMPFRKSFAVAIMLKLVPNRCLAGGSVEDSQERADCKCRFGARKTEFTREAQSSRRQKKFKRIPRCSPQSLCSLWLCGEISPPVASAPPDNAALPFPKLH